VLRGGGLAVLRTGYYSELGEGDGRRLRGEQNREGMSRGGGGKTVGALLQFLREEEANLIVSIRSLGGVIRR